MKGMLSYIEGDSFLHRLNPVTKLFLAVCICVSAFVSSSHFFLLGVICAILIVSAAVGIFSRAASLFKGLIKLAAIIFIFQVLFTSYGNPLFTLGFIKITDYGVLASLLIVLRIVTATLPFALVLSVTQTNDLTNSLVKKLHIPYKYAFSLSTAIKFIPVFATEMNGIIEAQTARGVDFDTKNPFKKIAMIVPLCLPLLLSSVRKTESTAIAAEIRGFNLRTAKSCYFSYKYKACDFAAFFAGLLFIGGAVAVNFVGVLV